VAAFWIRHGLGWASRRKRAAVRRQQVTITPRQLQCYHIKRVIYHKAPTPLTHSAKTLLYLNPSPTHNFCFSLLHTYLVRATAIKKAVCLRWFSPLHIGVGLLYQYPSGFWLAQFLSRYNFSSIASLLRSFGEGCNRVWMCEVAAGDDDGTRAVYNSS
jgi:hypothetical protein